jgi:hypothetical protein
LRPKSGSNDSLLGPTLSLGSKLGRAKWARLSRFLVPTLSPGQNFSLLGPILSPGSKFFGPLGSNLNPFLAQDLVIRLNLSQAQYYKFLLYLKYQLHEFIVKFNIKFLKGSKYGRKKGST